MSVINCKACGLNIDTDKDDGIWGEDWSYICSKCIEEGRKS